MTAAIILAGGRAERLGGADKPQLVVDGTTLLDHAVAAVAGCDPIIVVGPPAPVQAQVVWARETPPFGGPVAAISAALPHVASAEVYVLAADIPRAEAAVALLHRHPPAQPGEHALDGVCLADDAGRAQWLIGRYRTTSLCAAVDALPDGGRDASIRALLSGLRLTVIPGGELTADVDTWDDLEHARAAPLEGDPT